MECDQDRRTDGWVKAHEKMCKRLSFTVQVEIIDAGILLIDSPALAFDYLLAISFLLTYNSIDIFFFCQIRKHFGWTERRMKGRCSWKKRGYEPRGRYWSLSFKQKVPKEAIQMLQNKKTSAPTICQSVRPMKR